MYQTELKTKSIILRQYCITDAAALYEAALESIAEIYPWLPWCHPGYQKTESEAWINHCALAWNQKEEFNFAITDTSGHFLGACGLNAFDWTNLRANLGYWIRSSCTNQGLATNSTRLLASFGFTDLKLNRIEIVAATANTASQRVAEKSGAVREGIARHRLNLHGVAHDTTVFSFISKDGITGTIP